MYGKQNWIRLLNALTSCATYTAVVYTLPFKSLVLLQQRCRICLLPDFVRLSLAIGFLLIFFPSSTLHADSTIQIKDLVSRYFQEAFDVSGEDVQLEFIHMPEFEIPFGNSIQAIVETKHTLPRVGYQTLWLMIHKDNYLEHQIPVTIKATIFLDVVIANKRLKRGETLTCNNTGLKRTKVYNNYKNIILDLNSVNGLIAKQVIKENCTIRRGMVRIKPEVKKGELVTIQMKSGSLIVSTAGKSKQDGMIGEKVKVVCNMTGKQITGTVESPQLVVTHLE